MNRSAYPKCKPSGLGGLEDVPSMWPVTRLRFQVKINPVKSEIRGIPQDTPVSFVPMEAVGEYGGLRLEQTHALGDVANGYTYFRDGDVVVAKITPCFENGKGSIADGLENGIGFGTTELHVLRPSSFMDRNYLFYLTISHAFRKIGASYMYGAGGQKRVPDTFIRDFRHPIPTTNEQLAIAAFLDRETARIDALIEKKRRQIELLQEKRSALISHAVTKGLNPNAKMKDSGIEWLGEIPKHWDLLQLRRVVDRFIDYRGHTPTKTESGVPLITAGAIKDGGIDHSLVPEYIAEEDYDEWMGRGRPSPGDVVITTEAPLGEVAKVENPNVAFAQRVILFKVNRRRMEPGFLRYYYLSGEGRSELLSRASGSTASGIRADRLKMSVILTPPLTEQIEIVRYLDDVIEKAIAPLALIHKSIDILREHRTALISAAVTGKIDVRGELP